ncbi:MAG: hypothetical protein AB7O59_05925 [Pirellulales bacterium]
MRTASCLLVAASIVWLSAATAQAGFPWCPWGCCGGQSASAAPVTNVANTGQGVRSPAMITKVGTSTKRLVTNTKNLLTFNKPLSAKKAGTSAMTVGRPPYKEPGFFYKLFHPEPPPPPRTIEEWMSLKQIHP